MCRSPPAITEANIDDAAVPMAPDQRDIQTVSVSLAFGRDGDERFHAFVVDHRVTSAPRILSPIAGGHAQITMSVRRRVMTAGRERTRVLRGKSR